MTQGVESAMIIEGVRIVCRPDTPRYRLPEQVMPGVDWPPGFRDEINAWAAAELGFCKNLVPDGQAIHDTRRDIFYVNPRTLAALRSAGGSITPRGTGWPGTPL